MTTMNLGTRTINPFVNHRLRDEAARLGALEPGQIAAVTAAAQAALERVIVAEIEADQLGAARNADTLSADAPALAIPRTGVASLMALMGMLKQAMLKGAVDSLKANAALWGALSQAQRNELTELQGIYDEAARLDEHARTVQRDAQRLAEAAENDLVQASVAEGGARGEAERAAAAYDAALAKGGAQDGLDTLARASEAAKRALTEASAATSRARSEAERANEALRGANNASNQTTRELSGIAEKLSSAIQRSFNLNIADRRPGSAGDPKLAGAAALTLLVGKLNALGAKAAQDELESKQALYRQQQAARQAEAGKRSEEFEAQQRKAEQMQKVMGCIGKVLGAIVAVFGVVAAVFTGGASLALAGVGLALFAADQIGQAATGKSFISEALQPVMDHVLKPLMQVLSDVVAKALEACGVAAETARLVGSIIGGVLAGAALVAAAIVGGSVVGKLASKLASAITAQLAKLAESTVMRALSEAMTGLSSALGTALEKAGVKQLMTRIGAGMDRLRVSLGADTPEAMQLMSLRMKGAAQGIQTVNTATQSGLSVAAGVAESRACEAIAEMKRALSENKLVQQLIGTAIEVYNETLNALNQMVRTASATLENERRTIASELANLRRV